MLLAWVVREKKENSVQDVNRSLTQQLVYLCKQFLLYPFNYHFRVFSTQACSYSFLEPSSQEKEGWTEGSKKGCLLPLTRVLSLWWAKCWMDSVCGSAGGGLSQGTDKQCRVCPPRPPFFPSEEITVCIYEAKCWLEALSILKFGPSTAFLKASVSDNTVCRRLGSSNPLVSCSSIRGLIFLSSSVFIFSVSLWSDPVTSISQVWKVNHKKMETCPMSCRKSVADL